MNHYQDGNAISACDDLYNEASKRWNDNNLAFRCSCQRTRYNPDLSFQLDQYLQSASDYLQTS